jgi:hypothetical protein
MSRRGIGFLYGPCVAAVGSVALSGAALAGPPFVTDDPEPVDAQHFEITMAAQESLRAHGRTGSFPGVDINYGVVPDVQLHLGLSMPLAKDDGQSLHYGYGDTEVGVKVRFVEEEDAGWQPQVAIYPNLELPTGNARMGLGSGYQRVFLPVWLQKSFGDWTTYGGGGYWLNQHGDNRNYWFAGSVVQRKITDSLSLGGEIFEQGKQSSDTRVSAGYNIGVMIDIDAANHIIMSAGNGLYNSYSTNVFSYYAGYQVQF